MKRCTRIISFILVAALFTVGLSLTAGAEGTGFPAGSYSRSDGATLVIIPIDKKSTIFSVNIPGADYTVTGVATGKLATVKYDGKDVDIIFAASAKGVKLTQDGTLKQSIDGEFAYSGSEYTINADIASALVSLLPTDKTGLTAADKIEVSPTLVDGAFYEVKSGSKLFYVSRIGETVLVKNGSKLEIIYGFAEDLVALVENKLPSKEIKLGPSNTGFRLQLAVPALIKDMITVTYATGSRAVAIVNKNGVVLPRGVGTTQIGIILTLGTTTLTLASVVSVTEG